MKKNINFALNHNKGFQKIHIKALKENLAYDIHSSHKLVQLQTWKLTKKDEKLRDESSNMVFLLQPSSSPPQTSFQSHYMFLKNPYQSSQVKGPNCHSKSGKKCENRVSSAVALLLERYSAINSAKMLQNLVH